MLLCFKYPLFAQFSLYNKIISQAEKAEEDKNTKLALILYDSAFKIVDFIPFSYYDAFKLAVNNTNYKLATKYLINGTLKGLDISQWTSNEVTKYFNSKESIHFSSIKDSLIIKYFNSINTSSYYVLVNLKEQDQAKRDNSIESIKNDSLIFDKLIALSVKNGFPSFKNTGYGQNIAFLLLWHHRDEYPNTKQWQKIIPLIKREINLGNINPNFFEPFDKLTK